MSAVLETYKPNRRCAAILDTAMELVRSVPYTVTMRWLFYQLFQRGVYRSKEDYHRSFKSLLARARKAFYGGWAPDTLADDTREAVRRGFGYVDASEWLEEGIAKQVCQLDKWQGQLHYVEIWFEAAAMRSQFEYYTRHVTLRPFKGDPSLDFKWQIAKFLDRIAEWYPGKPITILYFGDLDPKGMQIPESAVEDIRNWCSADFTFERCGLNPGDELRFNLPENIDKPGAYQWEALSDDAARGLILGNLEQYMDFAALDAIEREEEAATERFRTEIQGLVQKWGDA